MIRIRRVIDHTLNRRNRVSVMRQKIGSALFNSLRFFLNHMGQSSSIIAALTTSSSDTIYLHSSEQPLSARTRRQLDYQANAYSRNNSGIFL